MGLGLLLLAGGLVVEGLADLAELFPWGIQQSCLCVSVLHVDYLLSLPSSGSDLSMVACVVGPAVVDHGVILF